MSARCTCPGLNISPDCPLHNYDPSEDEPDLLERPYERVLSDDCEPGDLG